MYKYNCRKCPIRTRCVDESNNAPGAKVMIRRAFDARTDTLSTWGLLQKNCLLLEAEKNRSASALSSRLIRQQEVQYADEVDETGLDESLPSALGTRLLKSRTAKEEEIEAKRESGEKSGKPKKRVLRRLQPLSKSSPQTQTTEAKVEKPGQPPDYLQPVPTRNKEPTRPLKRLPSTGQLARHDLEQFWLVIEDSSRHITLPYNGRLVLGRFDPNVGIPPDIDLNFEDQDSHYISRRHARIIGEDGRHMVEDLGSRSGVILNDGQMPKGPSPILQPGDRIRLGYVGFLYDKIPADLLDASRTEHARHIFTVTPTGRKMLVMPEGEMIIGHADPHLTFVPDIDLREDGTIASRVSRRHAVIRWRNGLPFIEDLGSSFGTRLLGQMLPLGKSALLKPGDHIWLGGCVLAYDIEIEGDR